MTDAWGAGGEQTAAAVAAAAAAPPPQQIQHQSFKAIAVDSDDSDSEDADRSASATSGGISSGDDSSERMDRGFSEHTRGGGPSRHGSDSTTQAFTEGFPSKRPAPSATYPEPDEGDAPPAGGAQQQAREAQLHAQLAGRDEHIRTLEAQVSEARLWQRDNSAQMESIQRRYRSAKQDAEEARTTGRRLEEKVLSMEKADARAQERLRDLEDRPAQNPRPALCGAHS